tara:strand:+ start:1558 stop:1758 length:201 start_codon:yes stop_codon:yes gene_type:complete
MKKSRLKMCDGSEYTVFYLKEKHDANQAGFVFEPQIVNTIKPNKANSILLKLFNFNNKSSSNNWDI